MKLGIVISTQPTKFSALRYDEDLEAGIKEASELGYDGVELAVREPEIVDVANLKVLLAKYKLEVPAIGTGQAFVEEGLSFSSDSDDVRAKAISRIKSHIDLAVELGTHVIIGLIRGRGSLNPSENMVNIKLMKKALVVCADYALEKSVQLYFEPLNRYESSLINTVSEGVDMIKELDRKNIKLLIDTFHMNIEEASLFGSIAKAMPYTGHMHFADSNRHAPGAGHIEFSDIVNLLNQLGYNGYISMEMLPLPTSGKAAEMSMKYLKEIMEKIA